MFWLIWQMGLLLLGAFALGLFFGRQIWSSEARSGEADEALAEAARLRRENETLARRLGEAESRIVAADAEPTETVKTGAAAMPDLESEKSAPKAKKPAATVSNDDLTKIKGLGPKAAAALKDGGITSYAQIAGWSEADIADWDARINGRGRIARDDWVGQAKALG